MSDLDSAGPFALGDSVEEDPESIFRKLQVNVRWERKWGSDPPLRTKLLQSDGTGNGNDETKAV